MPAWPCLRNVRRVASSQLRSTPRLVVGRPNDSGNGCPCSRCKSGFGSKSSRWLGPPDMNREIAPWAFGAWWPRTARSGLDRPVIRRRLIG